MYIYVLVGVLGNEHEAHLRYYLSFGAAEQALHELENHLDPEYDPEEFEDVYVDHIEVVE